jgi:DNA-binding transcriptional MerR regulator
LQWWDEQGVVTPVQRSHRRLYSRFEVLQVSLIIGLRRKGMSLQKTRGVLKKLEEQDGADYIAMHGHGADVYLLTDGTKVYLENSPYGIITVIRDSYRPIVGLCISDLIRQLDAPAGLPKPVRSEAASASARPRRIEKAS